MTNNTELRDTLAEMEGWKYVTPNPNSVTQFEPYWVRDDLKPCGHPFPEGSLNALAAVWPAGWNMKVMFYASMETYYVVAHKKSMEKMFNNKAHTEYEARLVLTVALKQCIKENAK